MCKKDPPQNKTKQNKKQLCLEFITKISNVCIIKVQLIKTNLNKGYCNCLELIKLKKKIS